MPLSLLSSLHTPFIPPLFPPPGQRKTTSCISLNQYIFFPLEFQKGTQLASFQSCHYFQLSGIYSDERSLQPQSPALLMLTGIIKTHPVSNLFDLGKNALGLSPRAGNSWLETPAAFTLGHKQLTSVNNPPRPRFQFQRESFSQKHYLSTKETENWIKIMYRRHEKFFRVEYLKNIANLSMEKGKQQRERGLKYKSKNKKW